MNAAIIGRMFWKEYRTQRGLWLGIVGGVLLVETLLVAMLPARDHPGFAELFYAGLLATMFYALGSAAVLYASEKEQGTHVWLCTLPLGPTRLLVSKIGWLVVSSLLAVATFALAAWVVTDLTGWLANPSPKRTHIDMTEFGWIAALLLGASLIPSLLSDHVLRSVGYSVLFFFAVLSLGHPLEVLIPVLLIAAVAVLNHRWLREPTWNWRWSLPLGRAVTLDRALALPVESSIAGRIWRRQLWLEWRQARWWLLGLAIVGTFLASAFEGRLDVETRAWRFSIVACFLPLMCGVLACRGEQTRSRYLFQGNRGWSSGTLLMAKHAIWFGGGALICTLAGIISWRKLILSDWHSASGLRGGLRLVPVDPVAAGLSQDLSASILPGLQIVAITAVVMYALGFFCSLTIATPVLSLFLAACGAFLVWIAMAVPFALGVPMFVAAIVPAVALLALPFYRGVDWIIGDTTRRNWWRFRAWCGLAVWTWVMLLAGWRVAEVRWATLLEAAELNRVGVVYAVFVIGLLLASLVGVACADAIRKRWGSARHVRWSPLTIVAVFLIGHNAAIAFGLVAYSSHIEERAEALFTADRHLLDDAIVQAERSDGYLDAAQLVSEPLPLSEDETWSQDGEGNRVARLTSDQLVFRRTNYEWNEWEAVSSEQRVWLSDNQQSIDRFLEADWNDVHVSIELRKKSHDRSPWEPPLFPGPYANIIDLVRLKAFERENAGELADAWSYHLALTRFAKIFAAKSTPEMRSDVLQWIYWNQLNRDLWRWQLRAEQTPERLANATQELIRELYDFPRLSDAFRRSGGTVYAWIEHTPATAVEPSGVGFGVGIHPWERQRALALHTEIISLNVALAEAIESGDIHLTTTKGPIGLTEERYRLLLSRGGSIELLVHPSSGKSSELVRYQFDPQSGSWVDRPIWNLGREIETTCYLNGGAGMQSPHSYLPPAELLRDELNFWSTLKIWMAWSAACSARAETGRFPVSPREFQSAPETVRRMKSALVEHHARLPGKVSLFEEVLRALATASESDAGQLDSEADAHSMATAPSSASESDDEPPFAMSWQIHRYWKGTVYQIDRNADAESPLTAPRPQESQP